MKDAVAQALVLRGSSDFESVEQYAKFVRSIVDRSVTGWSEKLAGEYPHLRALPHAPVPEYVSYTARVLKWSTIRVDSRILGAVAADRRDGRRAAVPRPR